VLDRLERGGHIRREPDPADRRKVVVHVVPESQQAIGAVFEPMLAASRELYRRYGDDELAVVVDFATRTVPLLREETLRLRDVASDEQASAVPASASSAGIDRATLRFTRGVARLEVDAVRDLGELYRASWHGAAPAVRWHDGVLNVQYRRSPFAHFRTGGALTIDAGPRWTVEVNGGVAHAVFDLRDTRVESLTINGGASSVDIHLPAPDGRLELRVNGGTNAVTITRPAGVPARARVKGGAANLVLDAQRLGAVGGGTDLRSDGYERATDSVDVQVRGGARSLSIIHR
jgi:hypothetical protein